MNSNLHLSQDDATSFANRSGGQLYRQQERVHSQPQRRPLPAQQTASSSSPHHVRSSSSPAHSNSPHSVDGSDFNGSLRSTTPSTEGSVRHSDDDEQRVPLEDEDSSTTFIAEDEQDNDDGNTVDDEGAASIMSVQTPASQTPLQTTSPVTATTNVTAADGRRHMRTRAQLVEFQQSEGGASAVVGYSPTDHVALSPGGQQAAVDGSQRRHHSLTHVHVDPARPTASTSLFASAGGSEPSLSQMRSGSLTSTLQRLASPPQQTHSDAIPRKESLTQRQEERQVYYGTQRQNPPVCASSTTSSRDWVRLNVGGRIFLSTFSTLCSDPNSVLTQICKPLLAARRRAEDPTCSELNDAGGRGAEQPQPRRRRRAPPLQGAAPAMESGGAAGAPTSNGTSAGAAAATPAAMVHAEGEDTSAANVADHSHEGEAAENRQLRRHVDPEDSGGDALPAPAPPGAPLSVPSGGSGSGSGTPPDNDAGGGELPNPGSDGLLTVTPLDVDEHNSILLDLDPDYFAPILNYLRHRAVIIPPNLSARGVLSVAEYLNVQGMVRQLAPERRVRRQVLSSWGSGGSGELGTARFQDSDVPTPVQVTPFGVKVVHMALGANYSCALSDDGNIYTFGNGDWGQLGLGPPKDLDVHPADKSAVIVVPRRIPLFEKHSALHVSAGYAFAMAIIKDYHVYFWGNNNHGQSGLGPRFFDYNTRKVDEPKLVDTLEGKRIVQLGCGSFFSLALGEDGTLYSWGLIECLGLGTPDEVRRRYQGTNVLGESLSNEKRGVVLTPQVVKIRSNSGHRIVRIHAGQWHSGAINSAGELFTWGVGYQGRLGHGTKEPAYVPTKVRGALAGHRVVDVACGSFHTVALTDRGTVFCWGDNASGQCGTSANHAEAVTSPYRVVGLEFIAGGVAKGISCGRQHTVVVMEGPQPGCQGPCCQLDYRGRPYHAHAQVYTFGESARGGTGPGAASGTNAATTGNGNGSSSTTGHLNAVGGTVVGGGAGNNTLLGQGARVGRGSTVDGYGACRISSQYQLVPGLERMNVLGVVSGLHHTFVYAEEIESGPQSGGGGGAYGEEGESLFTGAAGFGAASAMMGGASAATMLTGPTAASDSRQQWPFALPGWGAGVGAVSPSGLTRS